MHGRRRCADLPLRGACTGGPLAGLLRVADTLAADKLGALGASSVPQLAPQPRNISKLWPKPKGTLQACPINTHNLPAVCACRCIAASLERTNACCPFDLAFQCEFHTNASMRLGRHVVHPKPEKQTDQRCCQQQMVRRLCPQQAGGFRLFLSSVRSGSQRNTFTKAQPSGSVQLSCSCLWLTKEQLSCPGTVPGGHNCWQAWGATGHAPQPNVAYNQACSKKMFGVLALGTEPSCRTGLSAFVADGQSNHRPPMVTGPVINSYTTLARLECPHPLRPSRPRAPVKQKMPYSTSSQIHR